MKKHITKQSIEDVTRDVCEKREQLNISLGVTETDYLLNSPANAKHLKQSIEQLQVCRIKIRVFPDFLSSGFWHMPPRGFNIDESEFEDVIPEHLLIAVRYWHWIWEKCYDEAFPDELSISEEAAIQFDKDGQALVDAMNKCQDKYEFGYIPSFKG